MTQTTDRTQTTDTPHSAVAEARRERAAYIAAVVSAGLADGLGGLAGWQACESIVGRGLARLRQVRQAREGLSPPGAALAPGQPGVPPSYPADEAAELGRIVAAGLRDRHPLVPQEHKLDHLGPDLQAIVARGLEIVEPASDAVG